MHSGHSWGSSSDGGFNTDMMRMRIKKEEISLSVCMRGISLWDLNSLSLSLSLPSVLFCFSSSSFCVSLLHS